MHPATGKHPRHSRRWCERGIAHLAAIIQGFRINGVVEHTPVPAWGHDDLGPFHPQEGCQPGEVVTSKNTTAL
ncbi:hypothetical protein TPCG7_16960 [Cutibacterium granulosum]|nr:hypothetical protein TPCG7_16960 [Cutibacterium granulosum]